MNFTPDATQERWIPAPEYRGIYEVSDLGNVRRVQQVTSAKVGKPMKQTCLRNGYRMIQLSKHNNPVRFLVHRLVLLAWVGAPPAGSHANHRNGIRSDNRLENLEWMTPSENQKHSFRVLGRSNSGELNAAAKLTQGQVAQIREMLAGGIVQRVIANQFGVSGATVSDIACGRTWKGG
jgi:DNA-binding transcriptional regulator YiaG